MPLVFHFKVLAWVHGLTANVKTHYQKFSSPYCHEEREPIAQFCHSSIVAQLGIHAAF